MTRKALELARDEASEFVARATALLSADTDGGVPTTYIYPSRLSGAVRRQSMELTRALADLRKS